MKLHTVWARSMPDEEFQLEDTWSQFQIDDNPEGYATVLADARKDFGDSSEVKVVIVTIDDDKLAEALAPGKVEGKVNV